MADEELDLPTVHRIDTGLGSHIEPPMSETWPERDKLAWHASVCALDSGLTIRVTDTNDRYCLQVHGPTGRSSSVSYGYRSAWTYLNGVRTGALAMQAQD